MPDTPNGDLVTDTLKTSGSLLRAAALVRHVAEAGEGGAKLAGLVRATGMAHSTAHRVCGMLAKLGWIERDPHSKRYFLGRELAILGLTARRRYSLDRLAMPILENLSLAIGQTVYLLVRNHNNATCLARVESQSVVRTLLLEVGTIWPLGWGAAGMAILAALEPSEAAAMMALNQPRFAALNADNAQMQERYDFARQNGFASHQDLILAGISGVSAAVFDRSNCPIAAISTGYVTDWLSDKEKADCVTGIRSAACELTEVLGAQAAKF